MGKALLIALRYSAVRRQFKNTPHSKEETKLLDYQTQQMKLVPLMACGVRHLICSDYVKQMYYQLMRDVEVNKFDLMDVLHHHVCLHNPNFV